MGRYWFINSRASVSSPNQFTRSDIAADSSLRVEMPADLRELLCETNGVEGEYRLGLVWKLERIVEENLMFRHYANFRDLYMPFDHLYFFADAGDGDQLAFRFMQTARSTVSMSSSGTTRMTAVAGSQAR